MHFNNIQYELDLFNKGIRFIAGVDEVGRGPIAGPFVVSAVMLDLSKIFFQCPQIKTHTINDVADVEHKMYTKIKDSKLLAPKTRDQINKFLLKEVISYSVVEIATDELDRIGIAQATQLAFYKSIEKLNIQPQHILTDMFPIKNLPANKQTNIKRGDRQSISVAAASIIAKVYRDNLMVKYHRKYPKYGFDKHKGYCTKLHLENLAKFGPCEIHRKSFAPVKSLVID